MNVIIIEDESLSAELLQRMLKKIDSSIRVLTVLDSVKKSVEAFKNGVDADLIFLDIHLADGLGFELFSEVIIDIPVIFTTAYSEYAIKAFEVNSVDYLLKPVGLEELGRAIEKYSKYNRKEADRMLENMTNAFLQFKKQYKSRFMVKQGSVIDTIRAEEINHFITQEGLTFLVATNGKRYAVDYTLDQLEPLMSPEDFFRINRQVIIAIRSIGKASAYFNSRLVITAPYLEGDVAIVSRDRVNDFKLWLDR